MSGLALRTVAAAILAVAAVSASAASTRVVTLAPHLAELVCAAGGCDRLVGVADFTDVAQAAHVPRVGNAYAANAEAVLALRPDWVLVWDGGTPSATVQRLTTLQLPVEQIAVHGLDDIPRALEHIGERLGTRTAARAAAQAYRERLRALRAQYAQRAPLRVFYQIETAPAFTINRRSPIHEALSLCGATNVFADLPAIASAVNDEAVIAAHPDVVVTTDFEDRAALDAYWGRFPQLPAARHRVVVSADVMTRSSPRVLDGVQQLCEGLDRVRRQRAAR